MKKIIQEKFLERIGIILGSFYLMSTFFNSKLNMKIGYFLIPIVILKLALFEKEKIFKHNLKIYKLFLITFILGIIWNYISSGNNGVAKFISKNHQFIYGFIFLVIFYNAKPIFYNILFFLATNGLSIIFLNGKIENLMFENDLGRIRIILSLGFIYSLILILERIFKQKKESWLLVWLIFPLIALIKTNSRMTAVSLIVTIIIYLLYKIFLNKNDIRMIIFIFTFFFISINFLPKSYITHIKTSFKTTNNISNQDRIVMWKAGSNIIKENVIFGVGSSEKNIYPLIREYVDKNIEDKDLRAQFLTEDRFSRLHNMYIDFFVQNGILGLLYLFILLFVIPREFIKSNQNKEIIAAFFTMVFYYIYGLTWSLWTGLGISQVLFQIILAWFIINIERNRGEYNDINIRI